MANFLKELFVEWYEFRGYFVRRNVNVGPRDKGGYESELDIVAFNPTEQRLVHVEPSMDADSWDRRNKRFAAKFSAGKRYIPSLFSGFTDLPEIEQIALLVFAGEQGHPEIGGGRIVLIKDLISEIRRALAKRSIRNKAIPEQYQILRGLQFAANYWK